jgi:hypothetical protein
VPCCGKETNGVNGVVADSSEQQNPLSHLQGVDKNVDAQAAGAQEVTPQEASNGKLDKRLSKAFTGLFKRS